MVAVVPFQYKSTPIEKSKGCLGGHREEITSRWRSNFLSQLWCIALSQCRALYACWANPQQEWLTAERAAALCEGQANSPVFQKRHYELCEGRAIHGIHNSQPVPELLEEFRFLPVVFPAHIACPAFPIPVFIRKMHWATRVVQVLQDFFVKPCICNTAVSTLKANKEDIDFRCGIKRRC